MNKIERTELMLKWWQKRMKELEDIVNRTGSSDMAKRLELARKRVQYYQERLEIIGRN